MKLKNTLARAAAGLFLIAGALQSTGAEASPTLKVGDQAPLVEGTDQDGKIWKLADSAGKKTVLLYFYPKDGTPGCTAEACGLRDRMEDLRNDRVEVIGVSFDSAESHRQFREKHNLNFSLLADTDGKIADAYGTRRSAHATVARRVSFLIGLDGKINHITDTNSANVHLDEMKTAIARLKAK